MDDFYRQALRRILDAHGRGVCQEPRRLRGLLLDEAGRHAAKHDREVNVLISALDQGAVKELESFTSLMPVGAVIERAVERLRNNIAMSEDGARWAIETWAFALGFPVTPTVTLPSSSSSTVGLARGGPAVTPPAAAPASGPPVFTANTAGSVGAVAGTAVGTVGGAGGGAFGAPALPAPFAPPAGAGWVKSLVGLLLVLGLLGGGGYLAWYLLREPDRSKLRGQYEAMLEQRDYAGLRDLLGPLVEKSPSDPLYRLFRGRAYLGLGDYDKAREDLAKAAEATPEDAEAAAYLGRACAGLGDFDEASHYHDRSLALAQNYPFLPRAHQLRAETQVARGQYPEAAEDCGRALALDAKLAAAFATRAEALWGQQKYGDAVQDCDRALALNENFAEAFEVRARARLGQRDAERGRADADRAVQLWDGFGRAFTTRGQAALAGHRYDEALASAQKALERNPRDAAAYRCKVETLTDRGDPAAVKTCEDALAALHPHAVADWLAYSWLAEQVEQYDKAVRAAERALEQNRSAPLAHVRLAEALLASGNAGRAIEECRTALQSDRALAAAYRAQVRAHEARGEPQLAYDLGQQAVKALPASAPHEHAERAWFFEDMEDYAGARAEYDAAARGLPGCADFLKGRGDVNVLALDGVQAVRDYDEAIKLAPQDSAAFVGRGKAKQNSGSLDEAAADFQKAVGLNPRCLDGYLGQVGCLRKKGATAEALATAQRALGQCPDPRLAEDLAWRAALLDAADRPDEAIAAFTLALGRRKSAEYFVGRGDCYRDKGEHDRAVTDYGEALALNPLDYHALWKRILATARSKQVGKEGELIRETAALLARNARRSDEYRLLAWLYNHAGDYDAAGTAAARAVALNDRNYFAHVELGHALTEQKNYPEALKALDRAVALLPGVFLGYETRGRAYERMGEPAKAQADYQLADRLKRK